MNRHARPGGKANWLTTKVNGVATADEPVHLPVAWGSGNTFELEGAVTLTQLLLDKEHLAVIGSLRDR